MKAQVLLMSLSDTRHDPRVLRQIDTLYADYTLDVAGFQSPNGPIRNFYNLRGVKTIQSPFVRKVMKAIYLGTKQYRRLYKLEYGIIDYLPLMNQNYDLILVNDFNCLPIAQKIKRPDTKIFLDAHEYYFGEFNSKLQNFIHEGYRRWIVKTCFPIVNSMTTVSEQIGKLYEANLPYQRVRILRNIPNSQSIPYIKHTSDVIELIHHGAAVEGRGLVELINLVPLLRNEIRLNLMLVQTDKVFFNSLVNAASKYPNRIRFIPIVPTKMIVKRIKDFDLGIHIIPPSSINNRFALPNKFFEFIHANLGVITGPSPEMESVINKYSIGSVSKSFNLADVATTINSLSREKIEQMRFHSFEASRILNWRKESEVLLEEVSMILQSRERVLGCGDSNQDL